MLKDSTIVSKTSANLPSMQLTEVGKFTLQTSSSYPQPRPTGSSVVALDEGFIRTTFIKAIEGVDLYDLDIEVKNKNKNLFIKNLGNLSKT